MHNELASSGADHEWHDMVSLAARRSSLARRWLARLSLVAHSLAHRLLPRSSHVDRSLAATDWLARQSLVARLRQARWSSAARR